MSDEALEPAAPAPEIKPEKELGDDNGGGKRLPKETWAIIDTHRECNTKSLPQICDEYGVSEAACKAHWRRHKIIKDSKKHMIKAAAEVKVMGAVAAAEDPVAVSFEQQRRGRIARTRENAYNISVAIAGRHAMILKSVQDGTKTMAECAPDLKALRHSQMLNHVNQEDRLAILKAHDEIDEANLPTLVFRDLSQEEIDAKAGDDDDGDILDLPDEPVDLVDDEEDEVIEEGVPAPKGSAS